MNVLSRLRKSPCTCTHLQACKRTHTFAHAAPTRLLRVGNVQLGVGVSGQLRAALVRPVGCHDGLALVGRLERAALRGPHAVDSNCARTVGHDMMPPVQAVR